MQMVSEVMSRNARSVSPQESLQRAAQLMTELDVGALPVCEGERLVGMVTDRDITIRGTAAGKQPAQSHVDEVMSSDVRWCFEDQPIDEVMIQMADSQVRRIPVVSHDEPHRLIGVVSLGDVATKATADDKQRQDVGEVVEMVLQPTASATTAPGSAVGAVSGADQVAGQSGQVSAEANAGGGAGTGGVDLPAAGQSGAGIAGASGMPDQPAGQPNREGADPGAS